jgi:hypothetical protein
VLWSDRRGEGLHDPLGPLTHPASRGTPERGEVHSRCAAGAPTIGCTDPSRVRIDLST